jgi:hypothetical protein
MRLATLDFGHPLKTKALFAMIRVLSRHPVPDVVKVLKYRPEFFGGRMNPLFQEVMRGESRWPVADRELFASFVSKVNACEF